MPRSVESYQASEDLRKTLAETQHKLEAAERELASLREKQRREK